MEPIRIRVSRIVDFGPIVSIVGLDIASHKSVVVHVDHRPCQTIWDTWHAAGFQQPITFDARHLTLDLSLDPDDCDADSSDQQDQQASSQHVLTFCNPQKRPT